MNLFNRLAVILVCIALVVAAVAIIVLAWSSAQPSIDGLRNAVDWLDEHNADFEKSVLTVVAVLVGVAAFLVLILELLPSRVAEVKVTDLKLGNAVLSTAAINQRVEEALNRVPHVSDVRVVVKPKRKGVKLAMDLHVDPEANLAELTDEACETARQVLSERVHVALAEPPRARVFYRELRMRPGMARPLPMPELAAAGSKRATAETGAAAAPATNGEEETAVSPAAAEPAAAPDPDEESAAAVDTAAAEEAKAGAAGQP